eukprot:768446-Hanusia_phi.AAC.8
MVSALNSCVVELRDLRLIYSDQSSRYEDFKLKMRCQTVESEEYASFLEVQLEESQAEAANLFHELEDLRLTFESETAKREQETLYLQEIIQQRETTIKSKESMLSSLQSQKESLELRFKVQNSQIQRGSSKIDVQNSELPVNHESSRTLQEEISALKQALEYSDRSNGIFMDEIDKRQKEIAELKTYIEENHRKINESEKDAEEARETTIAALQAKSFAQYALDMAIRENNYFRSRSGNTFSKVLQKCNHIKAFAQEALEILQQPDCQEIFDCFVSLDDSFSADISTNERSYCVENFTETPETLQYDVAEPVSAPFTTPQEDEPDNYEQSEAAELSEVKENQEEKEEQEEIRGSEIERVIATPGPLTNCSNDLPGYSEANSIKRECITIVSESIVCSNHILVKFWSFIMVTFFTFLVVLNFDYLLYNKLLIHRNSIDSGKPKICYSSQGFRAAHEATMNSCLSNISHVSKINQISFNRIEDLQQLLRSTESELNNCKNLTKTLNLSLQIYQLSGHSVHNTTGPEMFIRNTTGSEMFIRNTTGPELFTKKNEMNHADKDSNVTATSNCSETSIYNDKSEEDIATTATRRKRERAVRLWQLFL